MSTKVLRALLLAAALVSFLTPPAAAGVRYAGGWGGEGRGNGKFGTGRERIGGNRQHNSPGGIAVDRSGDVFVADPSNNRIQKFSSGGRYLKKFGSFQFDPGTTSHVGARGGFILPMGLAFDSAGSLFIVDSRNDRVVKYRHDRFNRRIGRRGSRPGLMTSPWGIAVGGSTIYVVDQGNTRILRYSTAGGYRGSFGGFGTAPGQFRSIYGIAVGANGTVYVSETRRDQIDMFNPAGRYLDSIGGRGSGPGQFDQPAGLAIDPSGNLLVADCANQRIQRLAPSGQFIESFGQGLLRDPTFVAANRRTGTIYVSDYRRVLAFTPSANQWPTGRRSPRSPGRLACNTEGEASRQ